MSGPKGYAIRVVHEPLPGGRTSAVAFPLAAPACLAQAATSLEAVAAVQATLGPYLAARRERGVPVPDPDLPETVG